MKKSNKLFVLLFIGFYLFPFLCYGFYILFPKERLTGFSDMDKIICIEDEKLTKDLISIDSKRASGYPYYEKLDAFNSAYLYYEETGCTYAPEFSIRKDTLFVKAPHKDNKGNNRSLHIFINGIKIICLNGEVIWNK